MSGADLGNIIADGIGGLIAAVFFGTILLVLIIGGLIWGGIALYRNYNVKIEKVQQKPNVVYVTNYVNGDSN